MTKCYVSMTDKFMSNWGRSQDKTNKLVLECESYEEAVIVERNAKDRSEMIYVNICSEKPYYNKRSYFTSYHGKSNYKTWYRIDRPFAKEE